MKRVLAVLGAVVMIGAALLVRSALDGGDGEAGGGGGDGGPPSLLCAAELAEVCAELEDAGRAEVTVEPVGVTVDRLTAPDARLEVDGWLTLGPFPAQVDELRALGTGDPLFGAAVPTHHSTGLALVVADADRAEVLTEACGEVTWACVGDAAGAPWTDLGGPAAWGTVKPGFDAPDTSGSGLLVLTQAMGDHLGDPDFAAQDIDRRWLGDLEDAVPNRGPAPALSTLVLQGAAAYGAVGALGRDAEAAGASAQGEGLVIFYPAPMYRASVVLAPAAGTDLDDLAGDGDLAEALAADGWEPDVDGTPLPRPGVLAALRIEWETVA